MHPEIAVNGWAVVVAVAACFALGSLWYGPLFGKAWAREVGFAEGWRPASGAVVRAVLLNLVGTFLAAFVLHHFVAVWRPSTWGWQGGVDAAPVYYAVSGAGFAWLGFVVPGLLDRVGFEGKSWRLFGINAGYQFIGLQVMALILAAWR
jgi:hypothetical protein